MSEKIICAVEDAITEFIELFKREPTRFFTENDLVCSFYQSLSRVFESRDIRSVVDKEGNPHNLIHCEYPTPFVCDMRNGGFVVKSDNDRNEDGKGFRRGITTSWF